MSETATTYEQLNWFVLIMEPNHERAVSNRVRKSGFEVFLPVQRERRKWSDRVKDGEHVLFPGYVFARFRYVDRRRILSVRGVSAIVKQGEEPVSVDESEISAVRALVEAKLPMSSVPLNFRGQKVLITRGPLASFCGTVVRTPNACRVVVGIRALGCAVAVEVSSEDIDDAPRRKRTRTRKTPGFH